MKKHLSKVGTIVLSLALVLGTAAIAPEAKKVSAASEPTLLSQEQLAAVDSWTTISGNVNCSELKISDGNEHFYRLDGNVSLTKDSEKSWVINEGTLYLDLNGHTLNSNITSSNSQDWPHTIALGDGDSDICNLCVFDSKDSGAASVYKKTNQRAQAIRCKGSNAYCEVRGVTLNGGAACVKITDGANFKIIDGTITGSTNSSGSAAAVFVGDNDGATPTGAKFTMIGGSITGNNGIAKGGALYVAVGATAYLSGATITNNTSHGSDAKGGAICVLDGTCTIEDCTISGNKAADNGSGVGGGIYVGKNTSTSHYGQCIVKNTTIENNTAKHGAGIYVEAGASVSVEGNMKVSDNIGDNVYLDSNAKLTIPAALTGSIGVTAKTEPTASAPVTLTTGLDGNGSSSVFFSDSSSCQVVADANGEAVLEAGNIFAGCRLILTGNIGVRYYLDLDAADQVSGTNVSFNGSTVDFDAGNRESVNGVDYYYFDIQVNAAQMTLEISPVAHLGGSNKDVTLKSFSVKDVAEAIINGNDPDANTQKYMDLATAMLDYGARVQQYFQTGGELPIEPSDLSSNSTINSLLESRLYGGAKLQNGISFYGSSMMTLSRSSMRLYFKIEQVGTTYTFKHGSTELTPAYARNAGQELQDYYYVCLTDIAPIAYDTAFAVTINGDQTVSYSPLNYCARVLATNDASSPASLKALARSMCNYYIKASECSQ